MTTLSKIYFGLTPRSGALLESLRSCGQGPNLVFECEDSSFLIAKHV